MEKIANWISENPYFTAAGLIATFISLIIAIIIPIAQKKKKEISCSFYTTLLVDKTISKVKGLQMSFQGKAIDQLSVTTLKIWNSGNSIIETSDVYSNHKLKIISPYALHTCIGEIIDADIIFQSTDTIQGTIEIIEQKDINISFQSFEKKDYLTIHLYHTGDETTIFMLDGKIKEGKIVNHLFDADEQVNVVEPLVSIYAFPINELLRLLLKMVRHR